MGKVFYAFEHRLEDLSFVHQQDEWLVFRLVDDKCLCLVGRNSDGLYEMAISRQDEYWPYRLMDFISYINHSDLYAYVNIHEEDLIKAQTIYKGHNYRESLRPYEKSVLVHSSKWENWLLIQKDMCLKSWKMVHESKSCEPIGKALGDPEDFLDYVMLGSGIASEIVVLSSNMGQLIYDQDQTYIPGVRLYLDARKLAANGLLIRDGVHTKVKDKISLKTYLLDYITADHFDKRVWTPYTFTQAANDLFEKRQNEVI